MSIDSRLSSLLSGRRAMAAVLVVALVSQIAFFIVLSPEARTTQSPDYTSFYEPLARSLAAGQGYRSADGEVSTLYPPGFSIVLAAVFQLSAVTGIPEQAVMRLFIILGSVLGTLLVFLIARQALPLRGAAIAALLWSTYPFYVYISKQANSETPFAVLLFGALLLFLKDWRSGRPRMTAAAFAGLLLGFAALVRPLVLFLPGLLGLLLLWRPGPTGRRSRIAWMAVFTLCYGAVLAPWEIYVQQHTGQWIPVSTNGRHSMMDGMTFARIPQGSGQLLEVHPKVRALMNAVYDHHRELKTSGDIVRFFFQYAKQDPEAAARMLWLKITRVWYATNAQWYENWNIAVQIPYLLLVIAGFRLGWRDPENHHLFLMAAAVVAYFWVMAAVVLPILRYMVPGLALLMAPAAVTVDAAIRAIGGGKPGQRRLGS